MAKDKTERLYFFVMTQQQVYSLNKMAGGYQLQVRVVPK